MYIFIYYIHMYDTMLVRYKRGRFGWMELVFLRYVSSRVYMPR